MPVRHLVLAASALLVLGLVVFLFLEVRTSPAAPGSTKAPPKVEHVAETTSDEPATPPPTAPTRTAASGSAAPIARPPKVDVVEAGAPPALPPPPAGVEGTADGVKLEALMAEANKAYDRIDFDEARTIARKVLKQLPGNARMLRIMVSAACVENDVTEAQKHYNLLGKADRDTMKTRCARYGVTLADPPAK